MHCRRYSTHFVVCDRCDDQYYSQKMKWHKYAHTVRTDGGKYVS